MTWSRCTMQNSRGQGIRDVSLYVHWSGKARNPSCSMIFSNVPGVKKRERRLYLIWSCGLDGNGIWLEAHTGDRMGVFSPSASGWLPVSVVMKRKENPNNHSLARSGASVTSLVDAISGAAEVREGTSINYLAELQQGESVCIGHDRSRPII